MNNEEYYLKVWNDMDDVFKEWCHLYARYEAVGDVPEHIKKGLLAVYKLNPTFHKIMMPHISNKKTGSDKRPFMDEYDQEEYALKASNMVKGI